MKREKEISNRMETKQLNGKAIYSPKGKAGEYAKYACNFYVGCSNDCDYCYCKRGVLGHTMGGTTPTLKKCFKNEEHAFEVFKKELLANLYELRKHGIFFTFTSDPMIETTRSLTIQAVNIAALNDVPCKILTKRADFILKLPDIWFYPNPNSLYKKNLAFGFTLTGHDELERGASTNAERIVCMRNLHNAGFKTFASIEPIIDLKSSYEMINQTLGFCDLYKIGLMSGKRNYTKQEVMDFMSDANRVILDGTFKLNKRIKVYWKDSVLDYIKMPREDYNCCAKKSITVSADYNMFNDL